MSSSISSRRPPDSGKPDSAVAPSLVTMGQHAAQGLLVVLRRGWRLILLCFALGVVSDLALSPSLLRWIPLADIEHSGTQGLPYGPTLLAWWFLTPVLLSHCLTAQLRPAMLRPPFDSLLSPPPGTASLWWCGLLSWWAATAPLMALLVWSMPELTAWKPAAGWLLGGWMLAVGAMGLLALVPAALVDGTPGAVRSAFSTGIVLTLKTACLAAFGCAIAFVLDHTVLGLIFAPLAQGAADPRQAIGILLIILGNLFMALAIPPMAAAGGSAWQAARRIAWEKARQGMSRHLD